jgi:hypothetical protein
MPDTVGPFERKSNSSRAVPLPSSTQRARLVDLSLSLMASRADLCEASLTPVCLAIGVCLQSPLALVKVLYDCSGALPHFGCPGDWNLIPIAHGHRYALVLRAMHGEWRFKTHLNRQDRSMELS